MVDSRFESNHASSDGGALAWRARDDAERAFGNQLQRLVFADNAAGGDGGGLFLSSGPGTLIDTVQVIDNLAAGVGGATMRLPAVAVTSSAFVRNASAADGGVANLAIDAAAGTVRWSVASDAVRGRNCAFGHAIEQPLPNLAGDDSCGFGLRGESGYGALSAQVEGVDPFAAPRPGSAVIDAWPATHCPDMWARDLGGRARPLDGDGDGDAACDLGPVEVVPLTVFASGFEPAAE